MNTKYLHTDVQASDGHPTLPMFSEPGETTVGHSKYNQESPCPHGIPPLTQLTKLYKLRRRKRAVLSPKPTSRSEVDTLRQVLAV